jgi:hypothetical protein
LCSEDSGKASQDFESPPQLKDADSTPEEVVRDQPEVMSFPESTYNIGEANSRLNVPVTPGWSTSWFAPGWRVFL